MWILYIVLYFYVILSLTVLFINMCIELNKYIKYKNKNLFYYIYCQNINYFFLMGFVWNNCGHILYSRIDYAYTQAIRNSTFLLLFHIWEGEKNLLYHIYMNESLPIMLIMGTQGKGVSFNMCEYTDCQIWESNTLIGITSNLIDTRVSVS